MTVNGNDISIEIGASSEQATKKVHALTNALQQCKSTLNGNWNLPFGNGKGGGSSKGVARDMDRTRKSASMLAQTLNSLKRIAFYRAIRSAIKEIGKAFSEGAENAYWYSKTVGGEVSYVAEALDQLSSAGFKMSNQLGASLATLKAVVTPILTDIISLITRAADAVTQFFAVIGGKTTYMKAVDYTKEAYDNTAKGAKAAKEWKNQLLGFDELNRLNEPSSGGGGGGKAADDYENMFEAAEVSDWMRQVKEMLNEGKWAELANLVTDKLNSLVQEIPWAQIGETIGYYLNAAFTFGANFLRGFNWYELGRSIAILINNAISGINWKDLGTVLVGKIWALGNTVAGMLTGINWDKVAKSFLELLSGAIYGVDWGLLLNRLVFGVSKVFEGIGKALKEHDWVRTGEELSAFIISLFEDINWGGLASSLSSLISNMFDAAANLLKGADMGKIGAKLWIWFRDTISAINWSSLATSLFTLLGEALAASVSAIGTFIHDAVTSIFDYLSTFVEKGNDGEIDWKDIALGILKGIGEGFLNIGLWIYNNIAKPFVDGIKAIFGIHSPSELMKPLGENIFKGILEGIKNAVKDIGVWIKTNIWEPFKEGISAYFGASQADFFMGTFGGNIVSGLCNGIVNGLDGLGDWIATTIWSPISEGLNTLNTWISDWWKSVTSFFSGASSEIETAMGSTTHVSRHSGSTHGGSGGTFASGGFPEDGIFFANHNELVGRFSNGRTAVANNEQITEGIREAVFDAFVSAMSVSGGGNGQPIEIYLDGHEIARSTTRYQRQYARASAV